MGLKCFFLESMSRSSSENQWPVVQSLPEKQTNIGKKKTPLVGSGIAASSMTNSSGIGYCGIYVDHATSEKSLYNGSRLQIEVLIYHVLL